MTTTMGGKLGRILSTLCARSLILSYLESRMFFFSHMDRPERTTKFSLSLYMSRSEDKEL